MKHLYIKPISEIITVKIERLMENNSEPEVTENIGAKENNFFWDFEEDNDWDLWNDNTDTKNGEEF